jgi:ribose 5-phosphate isomerase A
MTSVDEKEEAARKALAYVRPGMVLGLGTGSTSAHFIRLVAKREKEENLGLTCIPTSIKSGNIARLHGLRVVDSFSEIKKINLAVDGADVIVGNSLIKGLGGGAIAKEKIVDYRAEEFIVIADKSKLKAKFCGVVPVEVLPLAAEAVKRELLKMGAESVRYRKVKERPGYPAPRDIPEEELKGASLPKPNPAEANLPDLTENGNLLLDAVFKEIKDPEKMEREIKLLPGVVENGIFTRKCTVLIGGL